MEKESNTKGKTLMLSRTELKSRKPEPFGDIRKYYRFVKGSSILLIVMIYYVSFVSMALRTESEKQIPIWLLAALNVMAVASLAGLYHRSITGYIICAMGSIAVLVLLSVGNMGNPVTLVSTSAEYGEVVRDGLKSTEFWILIAKVICVVHIFLSVLFIKSSLTVKEEPPIKGMNVKIREFKKWFSQVNQVTSAGWRPLEFVTTCVCIILWMLVAQANPFSTNKYDLIAVACILIGAMFVWIGKVYVGTLFLMWGSLTCCSMYQLRFQFDVPTIAAYSGAWISFLFLVAEAYQRRRSVQKNEWGIRFGNLLGFRVILEEDKETKSKLNDSLSKVTLSGAVMVIVMMFPIHEILGTYSGSYMNQQKDDLPLFFFLPLMAFVCAWGGTELGYLCSGVVAFWLLKTLRSASPYVDGLFRFDSVEQHGSICEVLTRRMNGYVIFVECFLLLYVVVSVITSFAFARRRYGRTETEVEMGN